MAAQAFGAGRWHPRSPGPALKSDANELGIALCTTCRWDAPRSSPERETALKGCRTQQQAAVAELGQEALMGADLLTLMHV